MYVIYRKAGGPESIIDLKDPLPQSVLFKIVGPTNGIFGPSLTNALLMMELMI